MEYIDEHVQADLPKKMLTLNFMIWLTSTKK